MCLVPTIQQITGVPPRGLTADEIEKLKKKLGVNYKFSKLVMGDSELVVRTA